MAKPRSGKPHEKSLFEIAIWLVVGIALGIIILFATLIGLGKFLS